jgi:hypothetical protein
MSTSKALTIVGVGVMTVLAVMLPVSLPAIMTPMCLIALGIGLNGPAAVAQASIWTEAGSQRPQASSVRRKRC